MTSSTDLGKKEDRYSFLPLNNLSIGSDPEADTPVPDRLLPKWRNRILLNQLRLSQKIGILLFLNRSEHLSQGGKDRLLYLQSKAPFEAIEAGLKFCQRLSVEMKLQSDFKHQLRELNRPSQSKRFRRFQSRRIGVGYRDKGALPEESSSARGEAQRAGLIYLNDFYPGIKELALELFPDHVVEEEWLDLENLSLSYALLSEKDQELVKLLRPL
jgi:hypothetical protein